VYSSTTKGADLPLRSITALGTGLDANRSTASPRDSRKDTSNAINLHLAEKDFGGTDGEERSFHFLNWREGRVVADVCDVQVSDREVN
jgi:hypothetical protein